MYEYEEVRIKMDLIQKNLLEQVAGLHEIPEGAYNIRANGTKLGRNTTAENWRQEIQLQILIL